MALDRIKHLQDRVTDQSKGKDLSDPDMFIEIHHLLMEEYGWIPVDEFREIPIPTLWGLLDCIKRQKEEEQRSFEKSKHKRGR